MCLQPKIYQMFFHKAARVATLWSKLHLWSCQSPHILGSFSLKKHEIQSWNKFAMTLGVKKTKKQPCLMVSAWRSSWCVCSSVRLTAAGWLLAQLQPIDGQSVGSSAHVALLPLTLHAAFAVGDVGRLNLVATVALCSKLQACIHVSSSGKDQESQKDFYLFFQDSWKM